MNIDKTLENWMRRLGIFEEDLVEKFILGTGSGGQKINKTCSCVHLHHIPTGIQIKCQESRSRQMNRTLARALLCRRIEERVQKTIQEKKEIAAKNRRMSRKRTVGQKEKLVEGKRKNSVKKQLRQKLKEVE